MSASTGSERKQLLAAFADLRARFGDDCLPKLLRAAWLADEEENHEQAMAEGPADERVPFDAVDYDFSDLSFWMEGMAESVWESHEQAIG